MVANASSTGFSVLAAALTHSRTRNIIVTFMCYDWYAMCMMLASDLPPLPHQAIHQVARNRVTWYESQICKFSPSVSIAVALPNSTGLSSQIISRTMDPQERLWNFSGTHR
ncbi:hypothetical protein PENSUB_4259 [Penicillium subrubescens]|uniref:Uncharacterized protein n=1 Tax=Penicillium subrubescens TaxID=1316194 RepID=A0A1Q5UCU7_9EURO|nr:hypothetical protein PENSUB_4259 [Penicillium subrubescens]